MKSHTANEKGFTLIETSIAMLVMMVVGLGATSLFLYAVRNNTGGAQRSLSMALAQQRAEDLRGIDYSDNRLNIGVQTQTIVVAGTTPASTYSQYGGTAPAAQSYDAPAAKGAGGEALAFAATPTPTPTPTTGGTTVSPGSQTFQVQTQVEAFPVGAAAPTQKRITIRVTPINGNGAASWMNQNPVEIVIRRSSNTPGPNKL
ncbi:MAG: hypothetical protein QOG00_1022 [Pyrinomonadaceae bacterium]|jgi:type II secretory pathway pseudopilin PulG|nr:hypothetical protein [Pyrinomonadaceae bacterium]